jgi:hypothetical protein
MARKLNEIVGLQLRFSERLRRKIEEAAKQKDRSMNQEIVGRLEDSFTRPTLVREIAAEVWNAEAAIRRILRGVVEEKVAEIRGMDAEQFGEAIRRAVRDEGATTSTAINLIDAALRSIEKERNAPQANQSKGSKSGTEK